VYQRAKVTTVDAARIDCPVRRLNTDAAGPGAGRKKAPLADAGHQLQPSFRQPKPVVKRREPPLQLGRGHNFIGQRIAERFQTNAAEMHGRTAN
jgi:hypothetical protein